MNDSSYTERKAEDQMAVYEGITYSRQDKYDVEKDLRCERIDLEDSDRRIDRPRQLYTGSSQRSVKPIFDR